MSVRSRPAFFDDKTLLGATEAPVGCGVKRTRLPVSALYCFGFTVIVGDTTGGNGSPGDGKWRNEHMWQMTYEHR